MKHTIHTPTADFAYVESSTEGQYKEGTIGDEAGLIADHNALVAQVKGGVGLDEKEFNRVLDEYLTTKTVVNGTEHYAAMNLQQQGVFQTIKRSFARTK